MVLPGNKGLSASHISGGIAFLMINRRPFMSFNNKFANVTILLRFSVFEYQQYNVRSMLSGNYSQGDIIKEHSDAGISHCAL